MAECNSYHPTYPLPVNIERVHFGVITPKKAKVWIDQKGINVPAYYYTLTEEDLRSLVNNEADILRSWQQHRAIIDFYRSEVNGDAIEPASD